MKSQGWDIEKVTGDIIFDRTGRPSRFDSSGLYQLPEKMVFYRPPISATASILGAGDRTTAAVTILAHELGHHDGTLKHKVHPGDTSGNIAMAQRTLATETRAILGQVHLAQVGGANMARVPHGEGALQALKNGDLGGYIYRNWHNWDSFSPKIDEQLGQHHNWHRRYQLGVNPEFRFITEAEARTFVNNYLQETFGPNLIDEAGKIRPFDVDAGIGKMNRPAVPQDATTERALGNDYRWSASPAEAEQLKQTELVSRGERNFGRAVRGLQTLGALGMAGMASDVHRSFRYGTPAVGMKIGEVGLAVGSFELGLVMSRSMLGRVHPYVGLTAGLLTGITTSYLAEYSLGDTVRKKIFDLLS